MSVAEAGRRSRPGELHRRRVVLVADSAGLAAMLGHLLAPDDRLGRLGSLRELPGSRLLEGADVVVLDLPDGDRAAAVGQVRRRYRGPLVVLAGEGEGSGGPDLDDACTVLGRPFSVEELGAALAGRGRSPVRAPGAGPGQARTAGATPGPAAAAVAAPDRRRLADRARRLLIALVEGWHSRRQVRVGGFAVLALLAFTAAFVLAAQGRCGPGCERMGTGLSPAPRLSTVDSGPAPTTGPRHPTSTTTIRVGPGGAGAGAFLDTSERRRATATTGSSRPGAASTATTTREPATTRPATTRPATTRPATTQSTVPPTTAPVTTAPVTTAPVTTAPTTAMAP